MLEEFGEKFRPGDKYRISVGCRFAINIASMGFNLGVVDDDLE
jgi:hypothetical protein